MCGIVGILDVRRRIEKQTLVTMRDALSHRGPDAEGLYISDSANAGLGFRRLSIIDLSAEGNQPLANEKRNQWIVFNGEIYNFRDLRKALQEKGHSFRSQGDAEVILHAYEEYGQDCLKNFQGMFAFAIWNEEEERLFIARDRFGIKPLYYSFRDGFFAFASELKALLCHPAISREIDMDALDDYLTYGYVPHDKSIFAGIRKLPAGHCLQIKGNGMEVKRYWELKYSPVVAGEMQIAEELKERLREAVKLWMVSDVPVGLFLSGGVDSSAVCAYAAPHSPERLRSFTIGFDYERRNETRFARQVSNAFATEHHEQIVKVDDAKVLISLLASIYDEPFYDTSSIPTYYVAKFAARKTKVVLAGDGGDEVFFGYGRYRTMLDLAAKPDRHFRSVLAKRMIGLLRGLPYLARIAMIEKYTSADLMRKYFWLVGFCDEWEKERILNHHRASRGKDALWLFRKFFDRDLPLVAGLRLLDIHTYLVDDILTKVDRASMANSLEARTPLLEHKLVEYVMTIPVENVYRDGRLKYIFKESLQGVLPAEIVNRSKKGFSSPIIEWLRGEFIQYALDRIASGEAVKAGLINKRFVSAIFRNYTKKRWAKIWLLFTFEEWFRRWMVD